jgi:DNA-binding transcriptional regulator GbsR (MarR family)
MPQYVPPEIDELVNQVGDFIQYWGFKNVQGRIWAHLFLSDEALDAAELMKRLGISKALVSISVKEMLDYEVIEEAGKSSRGTIIYRANPDQESVIMNVLRRRERLMLSRIASAHRICRSVTNGERSKLKISDEGLGRLGDLIQKAELALDAILSTADMNRDPLWSKLEKAQLNSQPKK